MISALKTAASGMEAQFAQIENISNNIANVNTAGYKKTRAEFQDLLYQTMQEPGANTSETTKAPVGIQRGMGVRVAGTQRHFDVGNPQKTERDLDMMVRGDGFFVVQMPNGHLAYKRDGTFQKSPTGRIETSEGYALQPEIIIPPNAAKIEIGEDGLVTALISESERVQIGQIQLATFVNNGGLKAIGRNLLVETEASGRANLNIPNQDLVGGILQRYIESSNVDVIREMTDMISAQRAFEMNSKVVQSVDQLLQHTVNIR